MHISASQQAYHSSQPASSDVQMQSSQGAMSLNGLQDNVSIMMKSDEGGQSIEASEDRKMKSLNSGVGLGQLSADEQIAVASSAGDNSSQMCALVRASSEDVESAAGRQISRAPQHHLNESREPIEEEMLHADAEEDLRMIQEQLRQFREVSIASDSQQQ